MAENRAPTEDQDLEFSLVTETYSTPTQTRRRSPGADLSRTGYVQTNVNGTGEFEKLINQAGAKMEDLFVLKLGANEAKGLVAAYYAREGEEGAVTVKRSKNKKAISFHLGHIFDKFPSLRPAGDLYCALKLGADKRGVPCIIINLRGTSVRKGRSTDNAAPAAQAK